MLEMTRFAGVAQLVERNLAKVEVAGSRPVSRSEKSDPRRGSDFFELGGVSRTFLRRRNSSTTEAKTNGEAEEVP